MSIKLRLTILNFLQFFVWGSWLISVGGYVFNHLHFTGSEIGEIFGTLGIASLIMPGILGIIADKFLGAEKVFGLAHLGGAACLYWSSQTTDKSTFLLLMLLNSLFYMPTIALNFTVSYSILEKKKFNIQKDFAPIRVWGTVGFIVAMWISDLSGWGSNNLQFIFGSVSSLVLGIYAFTLPSCKKEEIITQSNDTHWTKYFGLDALKLFAKPQMLVFFVFCIFLGAALQITNMFGGSFLESFGANAQYANSFVVKHPLLTLSISQISESLFILTIPFFLRKFGIKYVMLMSFGAWVLRFALFGIGNPGSGLVFLLSSMVIYGMAFDFFNISGSLFVEKETSIDIRGSAQGLFMMMTNGLGSILGGIFAGKVVDFYTTNQVTNWPNCWYIFAGYAAVMGLLFWLLFKYPATQKAS